MSESSIEFMIRDLVLGKFSKANSTDELLDQFLNQMRSQSILYAKLLENPFENNPNEFGDQYVLRKIYILIFLKNAVSFINKPINVDQDLETIVDEWYMAGRKEVFIAFLLRIYMYDGNIGGYLNENINSLALFTKISFLFRNHFNDYGNSIPVDMERLEKELAD